MKAMQVTILLGHLCMLHVPTAQAAGGDPEAGRRKTVTCNACHGQSSMQNVPNLGGQSPAYFISAMRAYQDGKRGHATMRDIAKSYSDKELKDFAAYYAQSGAGESSDLSDGELSPVLASCSTCHGTQGRRPVHPESAVIAGQKGSYLKLVIREYRDGTRKHAVMQEAARGLADPDIDAASEYYSKLNGLAIK